MNSSSSSGELWEFLLVDPTTSDNGHGSSNNDDNENSSSGTIDEECYHSHFFPFLVFFYLASTVLFIILSCGIEFRIFHFSSQGTPTQPYTRSYHVESLMEIKLLVLTVMLIILIITGLAATIFAPTYRRCHDALENAASSSSTSSNDDKNDMYLDDDDYGDQDDDANDGTGGGSFRRSHRFGSKTWWFGYGILLLSHVAETVLTFALLLNLLCQPKISILESRQQQQEQQQQQMSPTQQQHFLIAQRQHQHHQSSMMSEERWATRCHILCSCLSVSTCFVFGGRDLWTGRFGGSSGAATTAATTTTTDPTTIPYHYNAVARALSDYLETHGVLDVVPTDLVMGLLVLQRVQRQRILESRLDVLQNQKRLQLQQETHPKQQPHALLRASSSVSQGSTSTPPRQQILERTESLPAESISAVPSSTPSATVASALASGGHMTTGAVPSSMTGLRSRTNSANDLAASNASISTTKVKVSNDPSIKTPQDVLSFRRRRQRVRTSLHRRRSQQHQHSLESMPDSGDEDNNPVGSNVYVDIDGDEKQQHSQLSSPNRVFPPSDSPIKSRLLQHVLNATDPQDVRILQDGARFARYALSIYTWMMYLYVHPISGLPKLLCGPKRRHPASIVSDSCSSCCLFCMRSGRDVQLRRHARRLRVQRRQRSGSEEDEEGNNRSDSSLLPPISYQLQQQQQGLTMQARQDSLSPTADGLSGLIDNTGSPGVSPTNRVNHNSNGGNMCIPRSERFVGDTVCDLHKHSLLLTAQIDESELVYADFNNTLSSVPYCILLDHTTQSVVVSVRGTLSLEDLVTDVDLDPEPLESLAIEFGLCDQKEGNLDLANDTGDVQTSMNISSNNTGEKENPFRNQYAHGGVVACVRNLYNDLQRHRLLDRLLLGESSSGNDGLYDDNSLPMYPNYTLTLVGHSLGGAACVLLSYLLQPKFPAVRVWTFSPPGCTMTWELATKCQEWTTTFVLDSDLVPRLSLDSLEWLRNDVLQIIGRVKVPKYRVAQTLILAPPSSTLGDDTSPEHCCSDSGLPCCICNCWGSDGESCGDGMCSFCCGGVGDYEQDLQVLNQVLDELLHPVDEAPP